MCEEVFACLGIMLDRSSSQPLIILFPECHRFQVGFRADQGAGNAATAEGLLTAASAVIPQVIRIVGIQVWPTQVVSSAVSASCSECLVVVLAGSVGSAKPRVVQLSC